MNAGIQLLALGADWYTQSYAKHEPLRHDGAAPSFPEDRTRAFDAGAAAVFLFFEETFEMTRGWRLR